MSNQNDPRKHAVALSKRQEAIIARQTELVAAAKSNGGTFFDDDARKEFDDLDAEFNAVEASLVSLGAKKTAKGWASPRLTHPNSAQALGYRDPDGTVKSGSASASGKTCSEMFGVDNPSDGGFQHPADFVQAIRFGDSKMLATTGQGIGIPSDGGFAVPESFAFDMMDRSLSTEIVRPRCNVVGMTSDKHNITGWDDFDASSNEMYGGLQVQWLTEGQEIDYKVAKLLKRTLEAHKMGFLTAASNELLNDAATFESQFMTKMSNTIGSNLDRVCLVTGTGTGQPKSILNDTATIQVAKESGQGAATLVYENFCKMFSRLHPACLNRAVWIINSTAIPQLLKLSISVGTGGSAVPVMTGSAGKFEILTRPVIFSDKLNVLGSLGDVMFVDLSQYDMGILRGGMRIDQTKHLLFKTDETAWRVIMRVDGRGSWKSAYTPVSGDSLSWAVALAARS